MIEIFIPVLWICINANCEFMQSESYFLNERQCLRSLERQKSHMRDLVQQAGRGTINVMEGVCADARVDVDRDKQIKRLKYE
jgi:hypothetical protein